MRANKVNLGKKSNLPRCAKKILNDTECIDNYEKDGLSRELAVARFFLICNLHNIPTFITPHADYSKDGGNKS